MFKIIQGKTSDLTAKVKAFNQKFSKVNDQMHVLAVSVLYHAAKHRDTRPLNQFYSVLPVNLQKSLRLYLARLFKDNPVEFLKFSDGEFSVLKPSPADLLKTSPAESKFMALAETHLINPDGKEYKRFYERDIVQEQAIYGDTDFIASLERLRKQAVKDGSEVHPVLVTMFDQFRAKAVKTVQKLNKVA